MMLAGNLSALAKEQKISCDALPEPVRAAFAKTFAKATMNDCAKDVEKGQTSYEITSTEGEIHRDVRFYADGRVMEIEEPIPIGSVPEPAKQAAHKRYPNDEITRVEKVTRDGQELYEFRVKHRKKSVQIVFDANGKEVKLKGKR
jgi:hypothetical protein